MTEWKLRKPGVEDGARIWELVRQSRVLDINSVYCYIMFCSYFSDTCVLAEREGEVKGFVTSYVLPDRPDTLFLWQIGVAESERGQGVGGMLLEELLRRDSCQAIRYLETTITPSNGPSRALFARLAERLETPIVESTGFPASLFPDKGHEEEKLYRIGPLSH
ncbi:diaminobutyrate acetyltransferase [Paenibacillus sp. J2TS4]|uniref:diaminobutyrate acetyltransferase n=1 Tax=Paenibacillus sp. J2TS4 TaxID=2807194 RepID=UPI001B12F005|nr:diaminobutyrate acetyltransferase [Paenibacillus sp. J2TS4]GIP33170.1 L-2,4-diaminobutyric acid acetyltransferase [Paenibacillus sp. J2TS4]